MKKKILGLTIVVILYSMFIGLSFINQFDPGKEIGKNFIEYLIQMVKILPFTFILIGLFEVWVKRETIEKHLGENAGIKSHIWAILLGGTTIGPMIMALPIGSTLYKKGARLSVILTYLGAAAVCRIPMTIFEASYLGVKFTAIRYAASIPLIILSSSILGPMIEKNKI